MSQQSNMAISKTTKEDLVKLRNFPAEPFEDVVKRLIVIYTRDDDDLLTKDDLNQIEKSLTQIKEGKYKTLKQLREKYPKK